MPFAVVAAAWLADTVDAMILTFRDPAMHWVVKVLLELAGGVYVLAYFIAPIVGLVGLVGVVDEWAKARPAGAN